MTRLILIIVLVFNGFVAKTQTLKGITIGKAYTGNILVDSKGDKYINTTVSGLEGKILMNTLKDGRIYSLVFISTGKVLSSDVDEFRTGVRINYNIDFEVFYIGKQEEATILTASDKNNLYSLYIKDNIANQRTEIRFVIFNTKLSEEFEKEKQSVKDF